MHRNYCHPKRIPRHVLLITVAVAFLVPLDGWSRGNPFGSGEPFEQEFLITAYYSPVEGQCCYVKGGLEADRILNGGGKIAADGTGVYPGMIAAPPMYPFGARVELPGLGVFEVHDRGGAIQELPNGVHRLDIWVGEGEEGLARALTFGVKRVHGHVYPPSRRRPETSFTFDVLPPFFEMLKNYMPQGENLLALRPRREDRGPSVTMLQEKLQDAGYFSRPSSGYFGEETEESLAAFVRDYKLEEPTDQLTERTAAFLLAAAERSKADNPIRGFVDRESTLAHNAQAQRILRFLGYYNGRTNGEYSSALSGAILKFQQDHGLVGTAKDPGAGRIGPITQTALRTVWNQMLVAGRAQKYLDRRHVEKLLVKRGEVIERFLEEGEGWPEVRALQRILSGKGFFPPDQITGYFGPMTKEAVRYYQLSTGIIEDPREEVAGIVGPSTLKKLKDEKVWEVYRRVRGEGWGIL